MIVIPGPASQDLGLHVANLVKAQIVPVVSKTFPDGESYIRLDGNVKGQDVVIVQSTILPQDTHFMQLFLMVHAAKNLEAKTVTVVVPYFAYARQDKRFLPGEAVSIQTIIQILEAVGTDRFITVNIHEPDALQSFNIPAKSLSAIGLLAEHCRTHGLEGAFSLAPDEGALELVKEADRVLKGGWGWLGKERNRLTGEIRVEEKQLGIEGRKVIIIDDIISTGGTVAAAVGLLKQQGASRIYVACVHPLLIGNAKERILSRGAEEIVGTDCVPSPVSVVSVAPLITDALFPKRS